MHGLLLAGWVALCAGDATTTHVALQSKQVHEVLLTQSPVQNDAIVIGQAVAWTFAAHSISKNHPKTAVLMTAGFMALRGYAVYNNYRVIQQVRR